MTYEVNYSGLEGNAKRAKALADIVDYIGWEKFADVHNKVLTGEKLTWAEWEMCVSFVGIQGYPAIAWYEHIYGAPT